MSEQLDIESIKKLSIDPGDVVVIKMADRLNELQREKLMSILRAAFGEKQRILVLDGFITLSIVSPGKAVDYEADKAETSTHAD